MSKDKMVIIRIEGNSKALQDEFDRVKKQTANLDSQLRSVAKGSAIAFAALATTVGLTVRSFAIYETGLIGVGKTADLTGKELTDFGKRIQKLSTELPFATKELLSIAQAAGQLGVKGKENLIKFTETIAKLGTASDLTGQEAATALTRILNITREGTGDIDKFASVIVALGNSFAASEREIAAVATRVARATTQFNVSSAEAVAFAATLKAVGIEAEGAGSAVGRSFQAIDAAIKGGGESFMELQKLTGLTGDELKKTFQDDAAVVFQKFIEGLQRTEGTTKEITATLKGFGLAGTEILAVLPVLAKNSEELGRALEIAGKEMENATALEKEFAAQSLTLNNEVTKLKNTIDVISTQLGKVFSPGVKEAARNLKDFLAQFLGLEEGAKKTIATILGLTTAFFGIIAVVSTLGFTLLAITAGFTAIGITAAPVIIAVLAISAGVAALITNFDALTAVFVAVQAGFRIMGDNFNINVNKMTIGMLQLQIAAKKLSLAIANAIPGNDEVVDKYIKELEIMEGAILHLEDKNKGLAKSFEEVYDAIQAERMAKKIEEEAAAALEARTTAAETEKDRKETENLDKEAQDLAHKARLLEQDLLAGEAKRALDILEKQLLEAEQNKFNSKEILILKKKIADKKKIVQKDFTDIQKADAKHKEELKKAGIKDDKDRLDRKEKNAEEAIALTTNLNSRMVKEGTLLHKTLFFIEKASALASIAMSTAKGIGRALELPAPLSFVIAAAVGAAGAVQAATVASTALGLEQGGMVGTPGASRSGDRHPAMLSDGELVVPRRNFEQVVAGAARQRGFVQSDDTETGGGVTRLEISFTDEAAEFITAKQLENTTLGTDRG